MIENISTHKISKNVLKEMEDEEEDEMGEKLSSSVALKNTGRQSEKVN